jgi:hypothetical protein
MFLICKYIDYGLGWLLIAVKLTLRLGLTSPLTSDPALWRSRHSDQGDHVEICEKPAGEDVSGADDSGVVVVNAAATFCQKSIGESRW